MHPTIIVQKESNLMMRFYSEYEEAKDSNEANLMKSNHSSPSEEGDN
jgi:hypothetical protein